MIPIQSCGALVFWCLLAQLSRLSRAQSTAFLFPTAAPTPSPTAAPTEAPTPLPPGDMFARRAATTREVVATESNCILPRASDTITAEGIFRSIDDGNKTVAKALNCSSMLCAPDNRMYLYDRCITPRTYCKVTITGTDHALFTSSPSDHYHKYTDGRQFLPGDYVVIMGAASALGTMTSYPLAQQLDQAGISVINLGRGGIGPGGYLEQWYAIEKLVVNAAAVVIQAMALRSSTQHSYCSHLTPLECAATWREAKENGNEDLTFRMEDESFRRAMYEYRSLIERMDASPHRMNGTLPMKILSWNSYCDPSRGCQSAHDFPQWFHNKSRVDALFSLPWDHIADGNYNDMPRDGPSLPVDKCDVSSCPDMQHLTNCKRRRVQSSCSSSQFREAIKSNRDGCTSDCGSVVQEYYPTQYGQDRSFRAILPLLQFLLPPSPPPTSPPPTSPPTHSRCEGWCETISKSWDRKCNWRRCDSCYKCS